MAWRIAPRFAFNPAAKLAKARFFAPGRIGAFSFLKRCLLYPEKPSKHLSETTCFFESMVMLFCKVAKILPTRSNV
jgi:hypothetical protein